MTEERARLKGRKVLFQQPREKYVSSRDYQHEFPVQSMCRVFGMSRRGNCHDNAVAESFFATFKKRVTKRKIYSTRAAAEGEIFNFIAMFYNPIKRHSHTGGVSPA